MTGIHQLLFSNFAAGGSSGFVNVQVFNESAIWTAPAGVTSIDFLVVAGGASSGGQDGAGGGVAGGAG